MTINPRRTSAAHINVTDDMNATKTEPLPRADPATAMSKAESDAVFRRLRALKLGFGTNPNGHDLAFALIGACIDEGFDTRIRIVRALKRLDMKQANVVLTLEKHRGSMWRLDDSGRYQLLEAA